MISMSSRPKEKRRNLLKVRPKYRRGIKGVLVALQEDLQDLLVVKSRSLVKRDLLEPI
jgi:hypothetical protein